MAKLLKGAPVADAIRKQLKERVSSMKGRGVTPALAIIRVGEEAGQLSYEKGIMKAAGTMGINVKSIVCPGDISEEELIAVIEKANADGDIHGIMVLTPLPGHMDQEKVMWTIRAEKDVDGAGRMSMAGTYMSREFGYPQCTAEACMEILDYYDIDVEGRNVVIIGRSLVAGKPAAMMLLSRNATVTICHSKTEDIEKIAGNADLIVAAIGRPRAIGRDFIKEDQIVLDVGINYDEEGQLCGDVAADDVADTAKAITPVPGGVGTVTTTMLIKHVVEAAERETA